MYKNIGRVICNSLHSEMSKDILNIVPPIKYYNYNRREGNRGMLGYFGVV